MAGIGNGGASNGGTASGAAGADNGGAGNGGTAGAGNGGTATAGASGSTPSGGTAGGNSKGGSGGTCAVNLCNGCGTLSAAPNASCGTCGHYQCSTDKSSVSCNDPGTTNSCPTYCTSHPAPSGVAAVDYQCVDFDKAMPPTSTWPQTITGNGMLSRSNTRANSAPYSLATSVVANGDGVARIAYNAVGSAPIKSVSVVAMLDPVSAPPVVPPSNDIPLLCVDTGNDEVCLRYTVNGTDPGGTTGFTGLYIEWTYVSGAATAGTCPLQTTNLTNNVWSTVELDATLATGAIALSINGTAVASGCAGAFDADTAAQITFGPRTFSSNSFGWSGYYDNLQLTVRR